MWSIFTPGGWIIWVCKHCSCLEYTMVGDVSPGIGLWPHTGVHWVVALPTAYSWGCPMLLKQLPLNHSINIISHTLLGTQQSPNPSAPPCTVGRVDLFPVWYQPVTQLTLHLWWESNLVILVWWWSIKLMNLFAFGHQNICFSIPNLSQVHRQGVNFSPLPT